MTWFAVDDSFHGHPKLAELEAGKRFAEAIALWTMAGSWCAHHLTDGHVPAAQLRKLVPFQPTPAANELVRIGLWEVAEGGYQFRDWADYQPTREEVEARRAKSAARTRKSRRMASVGSGASNSVTNAATDGASSALPTLSRPVPSRPSPHDVAGAPSADDHNPHGAHSVRTGTERMEASLDPANERAIAAYRDGAARDGARMPVNHARRYEQAQRLREAIADVLPPEAPEADRLAIVRAAAAEAAKDEDHRKAGTPFAWFVSNIGRYLERAKASTPVMKAPRAELVARHDAELLAAEKAALRGDTEANQKHLANAKALRDQIRAAA